MHKLRIGDTITWRGDWGRARPEDAMIQGISVGCRDGDNIAVPGCPIEEATWEDIELADKDIVVMLDNGHWAYAYQITPQEVKK